MKENRDGLRVCVNEPLGLGKDFVSTSTADFSPMIARIGHMSENCHLTTGDGDQLTYTRIVSPISY